MKRRGTCCRGMRCRCWTCYLSLLAVLGIVLLVGCTSGSSGEDSDGSHETECMEECVVEDQGITYTVYLRVRTDSSGTILSVEDAGTQVPEGKDELYIRAQKLFDELVGKNLETMDDVDGITGATCSSKAILTAVREALEDAGNTGASG